MGYIKNLRIIGLKKFQDYFIEFNKETNILVGENESGKSTIIEAIDILINKTYENFDKYILAELFNSINANNYKENPSFDSLPSIQIIGEFELSSIDRNSRDFYGMNWINSDKKTSKYGIWFQCFVDNDNKADISDLIKLGVIPYEYYTLKWFTFKNEPYNKLKKTLSFVPIDASNGTTFNSLDFYSKRLFLKKYENSLTLIKTSFRNNLDKGFSDLKLDNFGENKKFGLNHKKLILENIIGVLDDDILIENKGKGLEKIIKTNLALQNKQNNDVIAIEEPENNLSHGNLRKLIASIKEKCAGKQLIITTHNNLIVTGLSLENVIWITENDKKTLKDLDKNKRSTMKTSEYFKKLENDNLLRFILANKVLLVEGPSEQLILPVLFEKTYKIPIETYGIDIICCNGLAFQRYLEIAQTLDKKVAVLTDNDGKQDKVDLWVKNNATNVSSRVFMPSDIHEYTWEVCLLGINRTLIGKLITIDPKSNYAVNGTILSDKLLAFMLNHKVDISMKLAMTTEMIALPEHLKELFEWIKQ